MAEMCDICRKEESIGMVIKRRPSDQMEIVSVMELCKNCGGEFHDTGEDVANNLAKTGACFATFNGLDEFEMEYFFEGKYRDIIHPDILWWRIML